MRKRILLCNDASFLATGFGTYGSEVLTYLYNTDKFELAELGCFAGQNDPRQINIPWKYYGNLPNQEHYNDYKAAQVNAFGAWRFDHVCLDFRPNIVWDIRDWWMLEFAERSPARPYFEWVIMPTVDAVPQDASWISTFLNASGVLSWTDWGAEVLKDYGINVVNTAPPGIDKAFKPVINKKKHKQDIGIPADAIIVGTVMRNQKRKLFPDLFWSFNKLLYEGPESLRQHLYLYVHTGYPDKNGWDIPKLLMEYGIGHRTLFTYICSKCGDVYPHYFQGARAYCKSCKRGTLYLPSSQLGTNVRTLANIYNLFDVYVQYASCEGLGMPQLEAAACGIPILALDYSAMGDIVRKVKGTPVKVTQLQRELESHAYRVVPDNNDFITKIKEVLCKPASIRLRLGKEVAEAAKQFTWERTGKIWEAYFDNLQVNNSWQSPRKIYSELPIVPENITNSEFVRWCLTNVISRPDLVHSNLESDAIKHLNHGYFHEIEVTRESLLKQFIVLRSIHSQFEEKRNVR